VAYHLWERKRAKDDDEPGGVPTRHMWRYQLRLFERNEELPASMTPGQPPVLALH